MVVGFCSLTLQDLEKTLLFLDFLIIVCSVAVCGFHLYCVLLIHILRCQCHFNQPY